MFSRAGHANLGNSTKRMKKSMQGSGRRASRRNTGRRADAAASQLMVLITGFGPFSGAPFNPTSALVTKLANIKRPAFAGLRRVAHVFRTSYAAVDAELA